MHRHYAGCRCGRGWRNNLARIRTLVAGVDPITAGTVAAVDVAWSHGLAGRSGAIRAGESSDPSYRFTGYAAWTRNAAIPPGATGSHLRSPNVGLPATSGDIRIVAGGTVMDLLGRTSWGSP